MELVRSWKKSCAVVSSALRWIRWTFGKPCRSQTNISLRDLLSLSLRTGNVLSHLRGTRCLMDMGGSIVLGEVQGLLDGEIS